jgi:hypothetical protein
MTNKILITGGAVHEHLDAVKIITNNFKGGRMIELAKNLNQKGYEVHYLTAAKLVTSNIDCHEIHTHNGFRDYCDKVITLAPKMDAVILGAAVCNLIPVQPWSGKFPSHNYKEGEIIPLNFTIAPRVINKVVSVAPKTRLFGFKLLKNVPHHELIDAAYDVVRDSHATAVFANDVNNLDMKFAVTKEKSIIPLTSANMVQFICDVLNDEYYTTEVRDFDMDGFYEHEDFQLYKKLLLKYQFNFVTEKDIIFGSIAVRAKDTNSFITTVRGKKDLHSITYVDNVIHDSRKIIAGPYKATLNAPLISHLFKINQDVKAIVHIHGDVQDGVPWAPPGTVRDTNRYYNKSFGVNHHGKYLLLREKDI